MRVQLARGVGGAKEAQFEMSAVDSQATTERYLIGKELLRGLD